MKTYLLKIAILVTLLFAAFQTKAQPDYIISNRGDSILCFIDKPFLGFMKYKMVSSLPEGIAIRPNEIRRFYYSKTSTLYVSILTMDEKLLMFLPVIERGKINLYEELRYGGFSVTTNWYFTKETRKINPIRTSYYVWLGVPSKAKRREAFAEAIKDNKAVYDMYLKDDSFTFTEIRKLIHYYNTGELPKDKKEKEKDDKNDNDSKADQSK